MSATSLFQKKLVELQVSASTVPDTEVDTFGEVAGATTAFAVAFNELQANSLDGTDANADSADGQSLAAVVAQQYGAETSAAGGDAQTALAGLASIGLRFNADPTVDPNARLTVDLPLLQVALEVDPATTTALLARAGSAFGALVQAEVAPADLGAEVQPPASAQLPELTELTAPAPGAAEDAPPDRTLQQATLAENARVFAAQRDDDLAAAAPAIAATPATAAAPVASAVAATPATATPAAATATAATPATPATVETRAATSNAELAVANAQAARAPAADAQAVRSAATARAQAAFVPATPAIPATPPATAAAPGTLEANAQVARQTAETPVTRPAAEKELADRAVELAENKRTQSAYEQERAELADRIDVLDRQKADQQRVDDRALELQRQQRDIAAQKLVAGNTLGQVPVATVQVSAVPQATPDGAVVPGTQPLAPPVNSAHPSARDPAVAAAIAAYSLSTGPFAALNVR